MTGQPTPDRQVPTRLQLRQVIAANDGRNLTNSLLDVVTDAVLAALEGCAVIDGTPRQLPDELDQAAHYWADFCEESTVDYEDSPAEAALLKERSAALHAFAESLYRAGGVGG